MKKKLLLCCLLFAALVCLLPAAFAATEPEVTFTFDKTKVAVGEIITANYEITGVEKAESISLEWVVWNSDNNNDFIGENLTTTELKGSTRCTPKYGEYVSLAIMLEDTTGRHYSFESKKIPVTGATATAEPEVTFTFDKTKVAVGETITANYEITGVEKVERVSLEWMVWNSGEFMEENLTTTELKGSISCVPKYGKYVSLYMGVTCTDGRHYSFESKKIPVTGAVTTAEPEVSFTFDKTKVAVGEILTANYAITGVEKVERVSLEWMVWNSDTNSNFMEENLTTTELTGSTRCVPKYGKYVSVMILLETSNGRCYNFESKKIPVTGSASSGGESGESVAPEVSITLDKQSVAVGEKVTAQYSISGEGVYTQIYGDWSLYSDEYSSSSGLSSFSSSQLSGSCSLTPAYGVYARFDLQVFDSNGKRYRFYSEKIPVTGDASLKPMVSITLDRQSVAVGELITARYEVTGEGEYTEVWGEWRIWADDTGRNTVDFRSSLLSGSYSCRPRYGETLEFCLTVTDADGRSYNFESEEIPITGDNSLPPSVTITFDRAQLLEGKLITANYEVAGEGEYTKVWGEWWTWVDEYSAESDGAFQTSLLSGSSNSRSRDGEAVQLRMTVADANGRHYDFESAKVPIVELGEIVLVMPGDLQEIRAEAFAGSTCMDVVCPDGLTAIGSRAFADCAALARITIPSAETAIAEDAFQGCDEDLIIVAPEGSLAEAFAAEHGYEFIAQ